MSSLSELDPVSVKEPSASSGLLDKKVVTAAEHFHRPTAGLFLATQLSKLKINTRIVDKAAHPVLRGHADGRSAL